MVPGHLHMRFFTSGHKTGMADGPGMQCRCGRELKTPTKREGRGSTHVPTLPQRRLGNRRLKPGTDGECRVLRLSSKVTWTHPAPPKLLLPSVRTYWPSWLPEHEQEPLFARFPLRTAAAEADTLQCSSGTRNCLTLS